MNDAEYMELDSGRTYVRPQLRVAFSGASGTGKTMLMQHVAEKYGLPVCPIGSRSVAKEMGFENPYDVDQAGMRMQFQARLFVAKRDWEREHESFVTDRTCFDNLTYTVLDGDTKQITRDELTQYHIAMQRYTSVFFLPVTLFQELGDDPHRVRNPAYHLLFDQFLWSCFQESRVPVLRLGQLQRRIALVDVALACEVERQ